jgi:hypothetical protein
MEAAFVAQGNNRGAAMSRHQLQIVPLVGLVLASAAMLGCANNNRVANRDGRDGVPLYEQDFARTRASIAEAEQAGAAEFGYRELALARDKLRAAEDAAEDGDVQRARELAVEADLDADLATAVTRNQQTQALVTEIRAGLRTLEDELRRADGAASDGP